MALVGFSSSVPCIDQWEPKTEWGEHRSSRQDQAALLRGSLAPLGYLVFMYFLKAFQYIQRHLSCHWLIDGGGGWKGQRGIDEVKRFIQIFIPVVCPPVSFPPFPALTTWVCLSIWHAFFLHSSFTCSRCLVYFQRMIIPWTPMYMLLENSCGIDYDSTGSIVRKKVVLGAHRR